MSLPASSILCLLSMSVLFRASVSVSTKYVKRDLSDFDDIRLNKEQYDRVQNMHYAWYLHSIKAVMGQMGKELFKGLPTNEQFILARCLNNIIDKTDLVSAAKCLTEAKHREKLRLAKKTSESFVDYSKDIEWTGAFGQAAASRSNAMDFKQTSANRRPLVRRLKRLKKLQRLKPRRQPEPYRSTNNAKIPAKLNNKLTVRNNQQGFFRVKATRRPPWLRRRVGYRSRTLTPPPPSTTNLSARTRWGSFGVSSIPIRRRIRLVESRSEHIDSRASTGSRSDRRIHLTSHRPLLARLIHSNLRRVEVGRRRASNAHRRFKRSPYRLVADRVSKSDSQKVQVVTMDHVPELPEAKPASPVIRVANLLLNVFKGDMKPGEEKGWHQTYQQLLRLTKRVRKDETSPGAKVYEMRMYDLVLGNEKPTRSPKEPKSKATLMEEAMELLDMMTRKSKDERSRSNGKVLSPRFAPLLPDKYETSNRHFSPSVLSFYHDDTEEQIASIPKLLEDSGLGDDERERMIEIIMELSGARATVNGALKVLDKMNVLGMEGELLDVMRRVDVVFKQLSKRFFPDQKEDMRNRGFTFLEPKQIEYLHRKQGLANRNDTGFDLSEYQRLPKHQRHEALWARIEQIASNNTDEDHRRTKRFTLLSVLAPTVLSPILFTPITGLSVLGPMVLSPSLFIPLLLNPAVLSPYVMSPTVGIPFILSPYLLSPYVISPLVFAPFILNPYCVAPNVINPYVLSPLILSPLCLCPDVVSPMVLGGAILSPSAFSPSVLSKSFLMAAVLSPSFLS